MPYKKIPQQSSEKKNIYPNKLMGQNFLRDKNVLNKIVAAANLTTKDNVLEIGPGLGVLTRELAKRAGRVVAVEKDRKSAQKLKEQLAEEKVENVEIVEGDILKFSIFHPSGGRPQDDNFQFSNKKNSNPLNPPLQGGQKRQIGEIFLTDANDLAIQTSDGALIVKILQLSGGKPLSAPDFLRGHKNIIGKILE